MSAAVSIRRSALLLLLVCICAGFLACSGGSGTGSSSSNGAGLSGGGGDGGSSSSNSPSGGDGGINFSTGSVSPGEPLIIKPANATISITSKGVAAKQTFKAFSKGSDTPLDASWTLSDYATGAIDKGGVFATNGITGGQVTVTAHFNGKKANAKLTVSVKISEDVSQGDADPGVDPDNHTALEGQPEADPGGAANGTKILYPYDKTVMPRGLTSPVLQFSPGNLPPEDAKIVLKSDLFTWEGYIHVTDSGVPQFSIPQDVWDAALASSGGKSLEIDVIKASGGTAYGPAVTSIIVAPASLKGAVYYMTYKAGANGVWAVKPGVREPAQRLIPGCLVCHSASANGTRLVVGTDPGSGAAEPADKTGVYAIGSDGTATKLADSPAGLQGDSRYLSYATFTPDGNYVMRSQSNFWGGINQMAWRIDAENKKLVEATVVGLGADYSAYVPTISPDGKRFAFTNGAGGTGTDTVGRSLTMMDLSINTTTDTLTFSHATPLLDNGAGGAVTKFANFLPDSNYLVFQEGTGYNTGYGEMLPSWGPGGEFSFAETTGHLSMIQLPGKNYVPLAKLNTGNAAEDAERNYEPFSLPVAAGGYYWVVFTSIREYGNTYVIGGDATNGIRKQIWVAAISTNPEPGEDPSHPAFFLPNQSDTTNERGFWALEPCRSEGKDCSTGDECCNGFCRPSDDDDPGSAKVCKKPDVGECSQIAEKCEKTSDCCDKNDGVTCINGFCTQPSPH